MVVASSHKCLHFVDLGTTTHAQFSDDHTQAQPTGAAVQEQSNTPSEVLSLYFRYSVSSIDCGPPNRVAFSDTCGNRYVLELS